MPPLRRAPSPRENARAQLPRREVSPAHVRLHELHAQKLARVDEQHARRQRELAEAEMSGCTFRPLLQPVTAYDDVTDAQARVPSPRAREQRRTSARAGAPSQGGEGAMTVQPGADSAGGSAGAPRCAPRGAADVRRADSCSPARSVELAMLSSSFDRGLEGAAPPFLAPAVRPLRLAQRTRVTRAHADDAIDDGASSAWDAESDAQTEEEDDEGTVDGEQGTSASRASRRRAVATAPPDSPRPFSAEVSKRLLALGVVF